MNMKNRSGVKTNPEKWVDEYGDYLYSYAIYRISQPETAQDLVQETFLSALKSIDNFKGKSEVKTWLTSILKNKIIDHYRKSAKDIKSSGFESENDSPFREEEPFRGHWKGDVRSGILEFNLEKAMESDEFQKILEWCMSFLSEKWAVVFALKFFDEYKSSEICKETGISSSNYWVIMHRARLKIRECLQKNWINK